MATYTDRGNVFATLPREDQVAIIVEAVSYFFKETFKSKAINGNFCANLEEHGEESETAYLIDYEGCTLWNRCVEICLVGTYQTVRVELREKEEKMISDSARTPCAYLGGTCMLALARLPFGSTPMHYLAPPATP